MPNRCERVVGFWLEHGGRPDLIATDLADMDDAGTLHEPSPPTDLGTYRNIDDWLAASPYLIGAAHAWSRRLFERFGPMMPGAAAEDRIMTFRAIVSGGALSLREPLVSLPAWRAVAQAALPLGSRTGGTDAAKAIASRWRNSRRCSATPIWRGVETGCVTRWRRSGSASCSSVRCSKRAEPAGVWHCWRVGKGRSRDCGCGCSCMRRVRRVCAGAMDQARRAPVAAGLTARVEDPW